jgi:hypothetical protein
VRLVRPLQQIILCLFVRDRLARIAQLLQFSLKNRPQPAFGNRRRVFVLEGGEQDRQQQRRIVGA